MTVATEGIILTHTHAGESDILAQVITEDHGIQTLAFRGIRKSRKRSHSAIEPGMRSSFRYRSSGQKIPTVQEFAPLDLHDGIRGDYDRIIRMYFLIETVSRTSGSDQADSFLYKMLRGALESLETEPAGLQLPLFFVLRLLIHHGLFPEQPQCSVCGKKARLRFYFTEHTLLCDSCALRGGDATLDIRDIGFIRTAAHERYRDLTETLTPADTEALLKTFILFIERYFRIELKTVPLLFGGAVKPAAFNN